MYCHITAILTPATGKSARLQELVQTMTENVIKNESDCHRYLMTTELDSENPKVIVIEQYKDVAAADAHNETSYFKEFFSSLQKENVLGAEPVLVRSTSVGGFDLDRKLIGK